MDKLEKLRNDLDLCDEILINTLRMRSQMIQEFISCKQELGIAAVQSEEEERKSAISIRNLLTTNTGMPLWAFTIRFFITPSEFSRTNCSASTFS
ncbi:hypothetical protein [Allobaculum sp. Allo2]|uniref:hypothetical protein n=1 Tax=Allobaculum sp. Allo2 TaxID=2853432 RepID=UPI001F6245D2|nr:hypothetical protein [Allobaculum sp. Allo2]UNT92282.1 hypothetical protein KWG61_08655 [Allobaculum sp. Allo2]